MSSCAILKGKAGRISAFFLAIGSGIVFFCFASILITSIGFILRIPLTTSHLYLVIAITLIYIIFFAFFSPYPSKFFIVLVSLISLISTFSFSFSISEKFFDLSYDGQAYHQEAIIQLNNGWNPFHEQLTSQQCNNMHRWLNHYSKGVWFYSGLIFKATKNIEGAKLFHFWLIIAAFLFTLTFLLQLTTLSPSLALFISSLVAFNPVSIYQSLSFYLDGQLMSLMIIFIVILGFIYGEPKRGHYWFLLIVTPVLINVKLTAGIYAGLIIVGFLALLWIKSKLEQLRKTLTYSFVAFILGFVLCGFSPYVTNFLQKGNPFYPAVGTDRADYTYPQFPANFINKNSFILLFYSIFSKSDNVRGLDKYAYLKIPFTISRDELNAFTDTNAKQGGFGPLFGGAILFSFLIIIGSLTILYSVGPLSLSAKMVPTEKEKAERERLRSNIYLGFFCLALVIAACVINPAASLARFIPHMWLFPIIAVLLAYNLKNLFLRILGHLILIILFLNNILIAFTYYHYNFKITEIYFRRLKHMAVISKEKPLPIYFGHFLSSNTLRFDRLGITYVIVWEKEECRQGQRILPNSILMKCAAK